jgi:hypothetical protein
MSQSPASSSKNPATTVSSSNFNLIFEKALNAYKAKTKQDLIAHPLASQLHACNSAASIQTVLQDQVHQFEKTRSADKRLRQWLNPTINVLYAFSAILCEGTSLVSVKSTYWGRALIPFRQAFPPAQAIFAGAGLLLLVSVLVYLFVRILVTWVLRPRGTSKKAKISS